MVCADKSRKISVKPRRSCREGGLRFRPRSRNNFINFDLISSRAQHAVGHSLATLLVTSASNELGNVARGVGLSEEVPQLVHVLASEGTSVTAEQDSWRPSQ